MAWIAGAPVFGAMAAGVVVDGQVVVYRDDRFHSAFPSLVRRADGELLAAFRRAPERRKLGEPRTSHTDPTSQLVLVRSRDDGRTWSAEPELIFAHPFGGSQDPCLLQLRDQSLLCSSYGWALLRPEGLKHLPQPASVLGDFSFLGGFLLRSENGGRSWGGSWQPPACQGEIHLDMFGKPLPAYNRGAMTEGRDGRIYWVVAMSTSSGRPEAHLLISADKGRTWAYSCPVARDDKAGFNETSIYETPKGDLVAFLRTADFNDHGCLARSTDHGKTFQKWEDMGFQGHPFHAMELPDHRVLLVYGYRHPPFGVRARVMNAECSDAGSAAEIVLRQDGGNGDLGYPWSTMVATNRVLAVYYFNRADGTREINGTFLRVE